MTLKTQDISLKPRLLSALLFISILLNTACSLADVTPFSASPSNGNLLTIDQISTGDEPGQFRLSGQMNLPVQVDLTVSAVRRLNATTGSIAEGDMAAGAPPIFGILDRRTATLEDGRWQATLTLWKTTGEGHYQEPWQRPEGLLQQGIQPNPNVDFLVTVEPKTFAQSLQPVIPQRLEPAIDNLMHFTPAGEPYLRVRATQPLTVPDSTMQAARSMTTQEVELPWQGRATLDGPNAAASIPVPPFAPDDNLPIPPDRLLR